MGTCSPVLLSALFGCAAAAAQPPRLASATSDGLLASYRQLREVALDPSRVAVVENLTLRRDAAVFRLKTGHLYLLAPVAGSVAGAVFVGEGVFALKPPPAQEQRQIARFNDGKPELEEAFREMVLVWTDATLADLSREVKFATGAIPSQASDAWQELRKTFREDLHLNLEARILAGLCEPGRGWFLASFRGQKHGRLFFEVDPDADEEVQLTRWKPPETLEIWSAFQAQTTSAESKAAADLQRANLDVAIDSGRKLSATAQLEFASLRRGPRLVRLTLAPSLRVTRVAAVGEELKFIQEDRKKDGELWIIASKPMAQGESHRWEVHYAGEDVIRDAGPGNFYVGSRTSWFPNFPQPAGPLTDRAVYRLKFRVPKNFTLVATGKLLGRRREDRFEVSEWDCQVPHTVVGFNYGLFRSKTLKAGDFEVSAFANPELPDELRDLQMTIEQNPQAASQLGITAGGFNTTAMAERTAAETLAALQLFSHYFGPPPVPSVAVTQQPQSYFGQSWPGLLFLPYISLLDSTTRNQLRMNVGGTRRFLEGVGPHEVAHQWWGHLVGAKSYHDEWLVEGFAQFSAGLFLHRSKGAKQFQVFLQGERDAILAARLDNGQRPNDVGPIWMGRRLESERTPDAFRLVYSKGGYVLHMLRMLLYDFSRDDDKRFIALMRDFVASYRNRDASTEDFRAVVEKHMQQDMGWFFQQWVYGTEIPKATVRYGYEEEPGRTVLRVEISMPEASAGFRLPVAFLFRSKAGALSGKLFPESPGATIRIPLPHKPESVEFNPFGAALCQLEVRP